MQTETVPRIGVTCVLAAQLAALLPHMVHLENWLTCMAIVCLLWRWMVHQERLRLPTRLVRVSLVVMGGLAILFEYSGRMSSEAGIALLIMSASLKLLELRTIRDAYLQVVLGYFIVATGFLFYSVMWVFVYSSLVVGLITAALISLQKTGLPSSVIRSLKLALTLCAQALPIMVLLFVFFPRMMPIWALNMSPGEQPPSLKDSMTPSELTDLAGKTELAFRVTFDGDPPPHKDLYWRALVFSHFDGERWSAWSNRNRVALQPLSESTSNIEYLSRPYRYAVMMQPTFQNYLVALDMPRRLVLTDRLGSQRVASGGSLEVNLHPDYRLLSTEPVDKVIRYGVESFLNFRAGEFLDEETRLKALQLPRGTNPRTQALALEWLNAVGGDWQQYIQKVLSHFRQSEFFYTLKPPLFSTDTVDGFLFESHKGYCAHYASAFVFLLRAAGIPARVVGGYMGGEINWIGNYVSVYQYSAHAWAEAWLPGQGWVRFDPTAEVAPERILDSIESMLERQEAQGELTRGFSFSGRGNSIFKGVRQLSDYASYVWYRDVVGFDAKSQQRLLEKYFNGLPAHFFIVLIFSVVAIVGVGCLMLQRRAVSGLTKIDLLYRAFQARLARCGVPMTLGETPWHFQQRAASAFPEASAVIDRFTQTYMSQQYALAHECSESQRLALRSMQRDLRLLKSALFKYRHR